MVILDWSILMIFGGVFVSALVVAIVLTIKNSRQKSTPNDRTQEPHL